jgi:predicted TIM-barrel fold metal-dependent hydrolase
VQGQVEKCQDRFVNFFCVDVHEPELAASESR